MKQAAGTISLVDDLSKAGKKFASVLLNLKEVSPEFLEVKMETERGMIFDCVHYDLGGIDEWFEVIGAVRNQLDFDSGHLRFSQDDTHTFYAEAWR